MFIQPKVEFMNAGIDVRFGNLGQDFVNNFDSFTLDFSTMTFRFGAPTAPPPAK